MADKEKQQIDSAPKSLCKYCSKSVSTAQAECIKCSGVYHASCALRISGLQVIGKSNLVKCCQNRHKETATQTSTTNHIEDTPKEKYTQVWEQLLKSKDEIIEELREKQVLFHKTIQLLEDKLHAEIGDTEKDTKKTVGFSSKKSGSLVKKVNKSYATATQGPKQNVAEELANKQIAVMTKLINLTEDPYQEVPQAEPKKNLEDELARTMVHKNISENPKIRNDKSFTRRNYSKRIGTGNVADEDGFVGKEKMVWLYVYRVKAHVTSEKIQDYLKKKPGFAEVEVAVKELPGKNLSVLKSFCVSAPFEKKDEMYMMDFWPRGVGVKRFSFNKYRETNRDADFL